jgi:hypothetical protein
MAGVFVGFGFELFEWRGVEEGFGVDWVEGVDGVEADLRLTIDD